MKYFAIFKDSVREALDSKVLFVMLALCTAVILILATMSFKPLSAAESYARFFPQEIVLPDGKTQRFSMMFLALYNHELNEMSLEEDGIPKALADDGVLGRMALTEAYELEKVELVDGEPDAPESDYALTILDRFRRVSKLDDLAKLQKGRDQVRLLFQRAEEFGFVQLGEVTSDIIWPEKEGPARIRYRVVVHGTPKTFRIWSHDMSLFFGGFPIPAPAAPLGYQLYVMSQVVILFGAWIAILVGVVITAFFIPNMLSKGTVDMLLVKPIHRWTLLVYKYFGGLTFILLINAYAILGIWLVVGMRSGVWPTGSLLLILSLTFFFAILYAISTLVGVLTRSTIASIILTLLAWSLFFAIGWGHNRVGTLSRQERQQVRMGKEVAGGWRDSKVAIVINALHAVTPRTEELNRLNDQIVYCDLMSGRVADIMNLDTARRNWWLTLGVSAAWVSIFLGLACVIFTLKDY
jgi:ABC-type transport system involved in multi-copper enzyme maturation permease subunit